LETKKETTLEYLSQNSAIDSWENLGKKGKNRRIRQYISQYSASLWFTRSLPDFPNFPNFPIKVITVMDIDVAWTILPATEFGTAQPRDPSSLGRRFSRSCGRLAASCMMCV
jgi:hypothetical protein